MGQWWAWLENRVAANTAEKYRQQLRFLIPEGVPFLRSELTQAIVTGALHELERTRSGSTASRYHAAWSSFFRYLVSVEVLSGNPASNIQRPRESAPRERYLALEESLRLVQAHAPRHRALAAFREGAGVEIGAALRTRRRDVDRTTRVVWAHGTKRPWRDRQVLIDLEFWPPFDEHARSHMPDALLWEGITADAARHQHRKACAALGIEDYRMHDARHSYAVRKMREGRDAYLIARNLGHKDATMVLKVYGKYRPDLADLHRLSGTEGDER